MKQHSFFFNYIFLGFQTLKSFKENCKQTIISNGCINVYDLLNCCYDQILCQQFLCNLPSNQHILFKKKYLLSALIVYNFSCWAQHEYTILTVFCTKWIKAWWENSWIFLKRRKSLKEKLFVTESFCVRLRKFRNGMVFMVGLFNNFLST